MSNREATKHWWMQVVTSVPLLPLTIWVIYLVIQYFTHSDLRGAPFIEYLLVSPYKAIGAVVFLLFSLYHSSLGLQVICEDYIENYYVRMAFVMTMKLFVLITLIACIFAIIVSQQVVIE